MGSIGAVISDETGELRHDHADVILDHSNGC